MITYNDFIWKWNTKPCDFDGYYGNQCVDLMRTYLVDVFAYFPYQAIPQRGDAKYIFENFKTNMYFKKVLNTPTNVPKKGDILFWGYPYGFYLKDGWKPTWAGHVAIFDHGDILNIVSFDQNWPKGSYCHFQQHNYRGVLGWLTPVK